jgi:hypothetical protein
MLYIVDSNINAAQQYERTLCCISMATQLMLSSYFAAKLIQAKLFG